MRAQASCLYTDFEGCTTVVWCAEKALQGKEQLLEPSLLTCLCHAPFTHQEVTVTFPTSMAILCFTPENVPESLPTDSQKQRLLTPGSRHCCSGGALLGLAILAVWQLVVWSGQTTCAVLPCSVLFSLEKSIYNLTTEETFHTRLYDFSFYNKVTRPAKVRSPHAEKSGSPGPLWGHW